MLHRSRSKRIVLLSLIALSISLILFRERILISIGGFLIVQDTLKPADVIHVIAGEDYRTDYAFQLYQQGYGKTVFFTGGWCESHLYGHGARAREKALARGVPLDVIASDDATVMSTYMEAERLKEWIASRASPVKSIIVVSDPFHMRRARWTYRKVFGNQIQIQMAPVPFELTPYQLIWWKDVQSRQYVRDEYEKFVFYLFRYQYSWGFLRDWLASFDKM
ncbi:MAG TPA: YdcF family protein [Anaerolineales bacterium]|nr:YdcF family protein [Anaerolineales bacterium]HLO28071.1 YdcF family protein [Anaerolineales bacterium]